MATAPFNPSRLSPSALSLTPWRCADLTGDGKLDIVTANKGDNTVSVLLGNGNGTFPPQETFAVGAEPSSVAVADLTGDGIPDIVTANYSDHTVSVLLGNGHGTFQLQQTNYLGYAPGAVAVADLTGDGKPDIIVTYPTYHSVSVLLGNGDGTFQPDPFSSPGLPRLLRRRLPA